MNADSAFMIGTTHSVCQDYAFARNVSDCSYVIVSDGCSSSPDTDIGARLIVRAATQLLTNSSADDTEALHKEASGLALEWTDNLGLPPQSVDATLLTAHSHGPDLIIGATGDGVVILESLSGALDVYSISFPSGFPLYPAYEHQPERLLAWQLNQDAHKEIRHFHAAGMLTPFELAQKVLSTNLTETMRIRANKYKQVSLISDGVHSFYKTQDSATSKRVTSIPMDQVLSQVVAFKGSQGAFVARRAKKFSKHCELTGWHHADDLAIGAIYLGD